MIKTPQSPTKRAQDALLQGDIIGAIQIYEEEKEYRSAIFLAEEQKLYSKVIELCEKCGQTGTLEKGARLAKKLGLTEKARELYQKAIDTYALYQVFENGARLAKEAGLEEQVKELYVKGIEKYEQSTDYLEAAELAEEAGILAKALQLYDRLTLETETQKKATKFYKKANELAKQVYGDTSFKRQITEHEPTRIDPSPNLEKKLEPKKDEFTDWVEHYCTTRLEKNLALNNREQLEKLLGDERTRMLNLLDISSRQLELD